MSPAPTYRVKDWNLIFENNRTRELRVMTWVPVPNKHDGDGYTALVQRGNAAALYGAWVAILQVASKCDPRGTLVRGKSQISQEGAAAPQEGARLPHDAISIARMCRLPSRIIQEALDVCTKDCEWLEIIGVLAIPQAPAVIPQEGAAAPQEGAAAPQEGAPSRAPACTRAQGREGKGRDWNGMEEAAGAPPAVGDPLPVPESLKTPEFMHWWGRWMNCRRSHKAPKDWVGLFRDQLEMLSEYPPQQAVNILRVSTVNNYQGLFPKNANEGPNGNRTNNRSAGDTPAPGERFIARNMDADEHRAAALAIHELHRDDAPPH